MESLWNFIAMAIVPMLGARADRHAEEGNYRSMDRMHYWAIILERLPLSILVAAAFVLRQAFIKNIVDDIPPLY
jgi:fructoselysine and glucoselysine-specific PTS system IIC component